MSEVLVPFDLTVAVTLPPVTGAVAVLTIPGLDPHIFDPAQGTELDLYYDPEGQFVQRNIVCLAPELSDVRAYYRPDTDSDREEWVFELGDPFNAAPVNLGVYQVDIVRADGRQVTIEAPEHFWLSRWRWQSDLRPVRHTVEELARDGLIPHYDVALSPYSKDHAPQTYEIMGLAGMCPNQTQTGERPDIGIITDWQADYVCAGAILDTVLAQAEAAGTFNINVRASPNGPPMDLFEWPNASTYDHSHSDPYIRHTDCTVNGAPLKYDSQHAPAPTYLPFRLTGDPYYLEALQFEGNADVLDEPPPSRWRLNGRGLAWSLRNSLYAWAATPEVVPSWLLPRSYWARHLDEYRAYGYEKAATPDNTLHLITSGGSQASPGWPGKSYCSPWQEDFLTAVFALAVRLGRTEWRDALLWKLDCTLARVHSDVWHQPNPSPYQISIVYACALAADCAATDTTITVDQWGMPPWPAVPFDVDLRDEPVTVTGMSGNVWTITRTKPKAHSATHPILGPGFANWAECYERNLAAHPENFPVNVSGDPEALYTGKSSSVTYPSYARGALALAVGEGVMAAEPAYAWLDDEFARAASSNWKMNRKWAISPTPASDTLHADLRLILFAVLRALAKLRRPR